MVFTEITIVFLYWMKCRVMVPKLICQSAAIVLGIHITVWAQRIITLVFAVQMNPLLEVSGLSDNLTVNILMYYPDRQRTINYWSIFVNVHVLKTLEVPTYLGKNGVYRGSHQFSYMYLDDCVCSLKPSWSVGSIGNLQSTFGANIEKVSSIIIFEII